MEGQHSDYEQFARVAVSRCTRSAGLLARCLLSVSKVLRPMHPRIEQRWSSGRTQVVCVPQFKSMPSVKLGMVDSGF